MPHATASGITTDTCTKYRRKKGKPMEKLKHISATLRIATTVTGTIGLFAMIAALGAMGGLERGTLGLGEACLYTALAMLVMIGAAYLGERLYEAENLIETEIEIRQSQNRIPRAIKRRISR
jgi:hypothetical protein